MTNSIVILSAVRTPLGHFGGYFKNTTTIELGKYAIAGAVQHANLSPNAIDEVLMGCVLPAGLGQAPARQAALAAQLPISTPCTTINKMCGSGMKAVMLAHDMIIAQTANTVIAGGMENMSRAPYLLSEARFGYRLGHQTFYDHMMLDGLEDAYDKGKPMGFFAEKCAQQYKISREAMDQFAITSLKRAQDAQTQHFFTEEIVPVTVNIQKEKVLIDQDEGPQRAKPEKIPHLPAAFVKDGTITAANSSSISDGAAALVLAKESYAQEKKLKPIARIIGHASAAQEPAWFTTAPIAAIQKLLKKINWRIEEVDLFEINEAFAVVTMVAMQELNIPHEKMNIHGGACVLGHPIGASGARILVTLLHALKQKKLARGIAALCIGGGEATAVAVELI